MGKSKMLIDELIKKKANGNVFQESNVKIKLIFKGVMPDEITETTPDSDELLAKIYEVAKDFNVTLSQQ
nr:hypothetical protein [uncultured Carboxylicivirga sp.]